MPHDVGAGAGLSVPTAKRHPLDHEIFVDGFHMREDDVAQDMIEAWAAEAEAGYDVEQLKRHRGRPGRGAEPMQVVAVRLTAEEVAALDAVAERDQVSRSEAIGRALASFAA